MAMSWTREQRNVTIAAYLGWTLDAFDFFLMVFVLKDIAAEFNTKIPAVAFAITLTLAARPIGALIFGRLADHFGRRPTLMINIACYSLLELASGFAPSLAALLVLRTLFGVAMGGEWGVGSALTMETVAPPWRAQGAPPPRCVWSRSPRGRAARCRACCRLAIRAATCSRRSSSACSTRTSAGAACS